MTRMRALLGQAPGDVTSGESSASPLRKRPLDKIVVKGSHRVRLLPVEQVSWIGRRFQARLQARLGQPL